MINASHFLRLAAVALALSAGPWVSAQPDTAQKASANRALVERGRYLVKITGCNDCHTPGYAAAGGKLDEQLWLTGDALGWRGPWGTTYATNLRIFMQGQTQASWLKTAKTFKARPPMPWFSLHAMTDGDLRALYHYVISLGPAGQAAPAYVPPDQEPKGPVARFPG